MSLLENLACYRDDSRWELMYRLAWRTLFENPRVLEDPADPDVRHAQLMDRAVRRDLHKMHAFVRFREMVSDDAEPSFFAWFEPRHETIRKGAKFFVKRFPNMRWTIATPDGAAVWDGSTLTFLDSEPPAGRPRGDGNESLWRTYYRSICNVSRLNPRAMQREMPQHYWRNLPECAEIPALTRDGTARFAAGHEQSDHMQFTAAKAVQHFLSQGQEAEGIQACRACDIWRHATQGVPGAGPADARIMLVGEQPGDQEDLRGAAFVGPAGQVLDAALAAAGLPRNVVYVTNAVKHFKWEPRGKRRLHKKPSIAEIRACNPWLQGEIATVRPRVIVALGTSALAALNGAPSIEAAQGSNMMHPAGARILAAPHPSAILRADPGRAEQLRALLERVLEEAVRIARIARE
jgi:DNA polymerase